MARNVTVTREIAPLPKRGEHAHKGDVGRVLIIGGCAADTFMAGAPALAAYAALRGGAGLVHMVVPAEVRAAAVVICPAATARTLPSTTAQLLNILNEYTPDVLILGPGLGSSLTPMVVAELVREYPGNLVIDADGLNLLAASGETAFPNPQRVVMTPHPGEARRLLTAAGKAAEFAPTAEGRKQAALDIFDAFGCIVVLKGHGTVVTNGDRLFVNATGNSGMATAGTGDVLTGIIAALIGQKMAPLEAAMLGVHLHGLAGDFAAEELGRHSVVATDLIDYLPEAFCEHALAEGG